MPLSNDFIVRHSQVSSWLLPPSLRTEEPLSKGLNIRCLQVQSLLFLFPLRTQTALADDFNTRRFCLLVRSWISVSPLRTETSLSQNFPIVSQHRHYHQNYPLLEDRKCRLDFFHHIWKQRHHCQMTLTQDVCKYHRDFSRRLPERKKNATVKQLQLKAFTTAKKKRKTRNRQPASATPAKNCGCCTCSGVFMCVPSCEHSITKKVWEGQWQANDLHAYLHTIAECVNACIDNTEECAHCDLTGTEWHHVTGQIRNDVTQQHDRYRKKMTERKCKL